MAQSFCCNFLHIVFSTKNRANSIDDPKKMWAYLAGTAKNLDIRNYGIGGTKNHVHLLLCMPVDIKTCDAISRLKSNSSRWMREQGKNFAWQRGYGAFSVSVSNLEKVVSYIANQEQHHRKRSFEKEFIALLEKHKIEYDVRYVFD